MKKKKEEQALGKNAGDYRLCPGAIRRKKTQGE